MCSVRTNSRPVGMHVLDRTPPNGGVEFLDDDVSWFVMLICTIHQEDPMRWWNKFHVLIPLLTSCAVVLSSARSSAQQTSNHHIKTVFIILMENKNWFMIKGNPLAPYINGALLPNASHT